MKNKSFQTQQDPFSKNVQGLSKIYHEVLLLMKFLQTKPQIKNMNNNYQDLYYTVIKVRDENKDIDIQYEDDDNEYINFNDIVPNHYIGIKPRETILKWRILNIHIPVSILKYKYSYNYTITYIF